MFLSPSLSQAILDSCFHMISSLSSSSSSSPVVILILRSISGVTVWFHSHFSLPLHELILFWSEQKSFSAHELKVFCMSLSFAMTSSIDLPCPPLSHALRIVSGSDSTLSHIASYLKLLFTGRHSFLFPSRSKTGTWSDLAEMMCSTVAFLKAVLHSGVATALSRRAFTLPDPLCLLSYVHAIPL